MKAMLVILALGAVKAYRSQAQQQFLNQFATPGYLSLEPQRQSVAGFGLAANGNSQANQGQLSQLRSFSNPPPPAGSSLDPASQTCGLAPPFCARTRYRSIDGSCNNLQRPSWGIPNTPYGRLTPYKYGDGVYALPRSVTGRQLPNAREVSLRLFPDRQLVDPVWNLNAQQWGQIITHDMSLTAGVAQTQNPGLKKLRAKEYADQLTCCTNEGQLTQDATLNAQCAPILVPPLDPVHSKVGTQCFNFVRTTTTRDRGCTPPNAPAQPLSVVTAFMDLSLVYGSATAQGAQLRAFAGGRLRTLVRGGREWPPQDDNITLTCESAQSPREPCYLTGDIRTNQSPELALLQVLLLREHNRIADVLQKLNPHWDDELIYQEARRIHIAEYQHINYYEYLPIFLGYENMVKNKLIYPGVHGYVNDYNLAVDPAVLNEHATAAFRHFHTLIRGYLQLASEDRQLLGSIRISDWFNRPLVLEIADSFNNLLRGMTAQNMDFSDQFWDSEITQFLFRRNNTFGGDLRATDIQRGRDHGLGSYIVTRHACGLSVPQTFQDMLDFISAENVQVLQSLYESPEDVDLVVGGSIERHVDGAQVGPTFLCILTEQFYRTRTSDRYFYENGADQETAFSPAQLTSIKQGANMARILCDNAPHVNFMQPKAFQLIGPNNQLTPCQNLPFIDLTLWQEAPRHHFK